MKSAPRPLDYLILGAGPGGLQLAYFLKRKGRTYRIIEAADRVGTYFEVYPRHRKFLSINKIHTGYQDEGRKLRYDWNSLLSDDERLRFTNYTTEYFPPTDDYVRYLRDYARLLELDIQFETRITRIAKEGELFCLTDEQGTEHTCRCLVVATGLSKLNVPQDVPGIELGENYADYSIDPDDYTDQRVLIMGKNNSGFETANKLTGTARIIHLVSPESVRLAWNTHYMGHLRAVNNDFLDTYHLKGQNSALDACVDRIERVGDELQVHMTFTHAKGQKIVLAYDRVLVCTGFRFDDTLYDDSCRPALAIRDKFPDLTSEWESTTVKDLYFAGTLMQMRDFHKTMSNFLHGFRHNIKALSAIFDLKYHAKPLPCRTFPACPQTIAEEITRRASRSPEMFLQPGFLCDVVVLETSGEGCRYYEGFPVDYVHESELSREGDSYFTVTLEYGEFQGDVLSVERDPDPSLASQDVYIHPVVRHFRKGKLVGEHHIPENLENDWELGGRFDVVRTLGLPGVTGTIDEQRRYYTDSTCTFLEGAFASVT